MTGGKRLRKARKVVSTGGISRGESNMASESPSTPVHSESQGEIDCSATRHAPHQSLCGRSPNIEDGIWLMNEKGAPTRRRGRTTCADIQNMAPGTRVLIEVNENNIPCNVTESILLGSYLGVIARDSVLAPISFSDWRNKGLEPFKKKLLAEVESKFSFPGHLRSWILQSIGVKWRNHKNSLKAEHWNHRPIEEIMESVPTGVDSLQWCQLVNQWSKPEDKERAARNSTNAKKQTCPHTMGRVSSIRKQKETSIKDRLQLWRISRIHKDGTWSSEDAKNRWMQACELLSAEGLTPEDGNIEANERIFTMILGPEHPGRVRTQGFGVTPTHFFPHGTTHEGNSSSGSNFARIAMLEEQVHTLQSEIQDFSSLRAEMREFMQQFQMCNMPSRSSQQGCHGNSSNS